MMTINERIEDIAGMREVLNMYLDGIANPAETDLAWRCHCANKLAHSLAAKCEALESILKAEAKA